VRIQLSLKDHPETDVTTLIEQLRSADILVSGGADLGDGQAAIIFPAPEETDRAIAWLAKAGIHAARG
jgi:hypothetical protein